MTKPTGLLKSIVSLIYFIIPFFLNGHTKNEQISCIKENGKEYADNIENVNDLSEKPLLTKNHFEW